MTQRTRSRAPGNHITNREAQKRLHGESLSPGSKSQKADKPSKKKSQPWRAQAFDRLQKKLRNSTYLRDVPEFFKKNLEP